MTQPHLLVEAGDVNDLVLVPGDPGRVERIAARCDESREVARNREYLVVDAEYEGRPLTICSTGIGSPSAAIAAEEFAAVGAETLVRVGTTGALQPSMDVGDVVVATAAGKEEGTSRRYESVEYPAVPDFETTRALVDAAEARDEDVHVGPVVTDDAYYAETDDRVADWTAAGLLAVEMEAAALFTVARRSGMRAGALCTVDGNLAAGTQKTEAADGEELPAKARNNVERMIGVALEAATTLA
ncbi:MAG: uridine phosphorylase [uncultured archaeon A07HB70]|nr:MAG: uridine phosphorylase [uncultured archaeon A07HB70]